ncbi:carbon-nitrogen hydrolase family protein [Oxalobacteraceae bacterium]|nr:carbon-nitrogen hydrolase family protein [Oxalobacteraceae bacterium]
MPAVRPAPLELPLWQRLAAAGGAGVALACVLGLHPVWWLAWIAPVPMLLLALRSGVGTARWSVALAALIGLSVNIPYFSLLMPAPLVLAVLLARTLLMLIVVMGARRVILRYGSWWTVFAYPLFHTGVDTLMLALLPDGNWGSLAYTQADFLPALQVSTVFGLSGLLFLLSLPASALALALSYRGRMPQAGRAYAATTLIVVAGLGYGALRLQLGAPAAAEPSNGALPITSPASPATTFGLVAIDDLIFPAMPAAQAEAIWRQYSDHAAALAARGAQVIVLPEKIAVLAPAQADRLRRVFGALAARLKVWIALGVGLENGGTLQNRAWLFAPDGTQVQNYQKHHLAPPERHYQAGSDYALQGIAGHSYGLAICKDMHFGELGREYGERGASVMLVPAWDFRLDAAMTAGMTVMRGVENGYMVVRSAREGLLTVSDAYGRVLASASSASMPGTTLLAKANVAAPVATLYTRIGDGFGWLCVAVSAALTVSGRQKKIAQRRKAALEAYTD